MYDNLQIISGLIMLACTFSWHCDHLVLIECRKHMISGLYYIYVKLTLSLPHPHKKPWWDRLARLWQLQQAKMLPYMTREPSGTTKLKSPGGATKMHNSDLGPWTRIRSRALSIESLAFYHWATIWESRSLVVQAIKCNSILLLPQVPLWTQFVLLKPSLKMTGHEQDTFTVPKISQ